MADFVGEDAAWILDADTGYAWDDKGLIADDSIAGESFPTPTITNITPAAPSAILKDQGITFTISLATTRVIIMVKFAALAVWEVAYDGTSWSPPYAASSRVIDSTYTVMRAPEWPDQPNIVVAAFSGHEL
jgi:hypothetical protein